MAKRKDSRGIVLNQGESQLKSGKYRYRYNDYEGGTHDVYSWRLRPEDPIPEGKKVGESLRELEKQIKKDLEDNLKAWKGGITLNSLICEYIEKQKKYWEIGTINGYEYSYQRHIKPKFGLKKVSSITSDDIEKFYEGLLYNPERPLKISSISTLDNLVKPALQMAVRKNIIRFNPADGVISQLKKKCLEGLPNQKEAMEEEDQVKLLQYIQNSNVYNQYYPIFYLLAWTGCRINELLALTWQDIDFSNEVIHVCRSLSYKKIDGSFQFILKEPKTKNGIREIPMLAGVKDILMDMKELSGTQNITVFSDAAVSKENMELFVFRNSRGKFYDYASIDYKLKHIIMRYNKEHKEKLPDISCHTFRHNFCCWLCENVEGTNSADDIKYIQSIMGHSDAATTLNIYSQLRKANQSGKHEALKRKAKG